jgi:hypothetical protein
MIPRLVSGGAGARSIRIATDVLCMRCIAPCPLTRASAMCYKPTPPSCALLALVGRLVLAENAEPCTVEVHEPAHALRQPIQRTRSLVGLKPFSLPGQVRGGGGLCGPRGGSGWLQQLPMFDRCGGSCGATRRCSVRGWDELGRMASNAVRPDFKPDWHGRLSRTAGSARIVKLSVLE